MSRICMVVVLAGFACSETGLTGIDEQEDPRDEVEEPGAPDLVVSPAELTFAPLARGEEATATVELLNDGDALLTLDDLFLLEDTGDFRLDLPEDWTLDPGQVETVEVRLRPSSAEDPSDTLRIRSDDPTGGRVDVPISGEVLLPELVVEPSSFDFGGVRVDTEASVEVVVTNIGDADATLQTSSYVSSSADLDLVEGLGDAVVLPPSGSHAFDVRFTPTEAGAVEGTLYVSTDVPGQTQVASFHEGNGLGDLRPALIGIDAEGELWELDPSSGASTRLATMDPVAAYGLSYDPSSGTIWVLSGLDGSVQLRTLDPCTGVTTLEHRLSFPTTQTNRPEGFTVSDDGSRIWLAWGRGSYDSDELGWLDPRTGAITRVGDIEGTV